MIVSVVVEISFSKGKSLPEVGDVGEEMGEMGGGGWADAVTSGGC